MKARIQFYPLGNADTLLIDLSDGRKVLIDYADMRNRDDNDDKRCDLPEELRSNLKQSTRNHFDVVCITHTDEDHCKGFGDFFWLTHAEKYQEDHRIKINELWVPAAAILEENLEGDARILRSEARYRLKEGKGIKVFSRPERLKKWLEKEGLDFKTRKGLIVDAGTLVPGFKKDGPEQVEFFVHCPFGWKQDENTVIDRNEDSIVMQATFIEGGHESRLLLASDINHETITEIVKVTRKNKNEDRLRWDIMKLPHHCSYLSLGPDRGEDETAPIPEVKWLFERQSEQSSVIVSPSWAIPEKGSEGDKSDQPPHRQAANYHHSNSNQREGEFVVTMERPSEANPKPFAYNVTASGIALAVVTAPNIGTSAASVTPRAGK